MRKRRPWLVGIGGYLNLIALATFYVVELGGHGILSALFVMPLTGRWLFEYWFWILALGLVLTWLGNGSLPLGRWNQLVDGLQASSLEFYRSVKSELQARETPDVRFHVVQLRQGGVLTARRKHLRLSHRHFYFDLCAAPFGKDFGISWRCYRFGRFMETALLALPVLGWLLYWLIYRYTPYAEDQGLYFQTAAHRSLSVALQGLTEEQGLRALSEAEMEPILADMARRWG